MQQFTTQQIRNVALLGHSGAGKTSLAEAMLFASQAITRLGRVEDGSAASDFEPEEQRRQTSLQLAVLPCVWKGVKINVIDTPGYADFVGETLSALRAVDAAVLVLAAPSGVEVGAETAWERLRDAGVPTIAFVNKMDREHADYEGTLDQARTLFASKCAAVNLPIGAEASFSGVADCVGADAPAGMEDAFATAKDQLAEAGRRNGRRTHGEVLGRGRPQRRGTGAGAARGRSRRADRSRARGLVRERRRHSRIAGRHRPLRAVSGRGAAAKALKAGAEVELPADADGPLAAFVFKTTADPFVGKLSYFRVVSGTVSANGEVANSRTGDMERVGQGVRSGGQEARERSEPRGGRRGLRLETRAHGHGGHAVDEGGRAHAAEDGVSRGGVPQRGASQEQGGLGETLDVARAAHGGRPFAGYEPYEPGAGDGRVGRHGDGEHARGGYGGACEAEVRRRVGTRASARGVPRDDFAGDERGVQAQEADGRARAIRARAAAAGAAGAGRGIRVRLGGRGRQRASRVHSGGREGACTRRWTKARSRGSPSWTCGLSSRTGVRTRWTRPARVSRSRAGWR